MGRITPIIFVLVITSAAYVSDGCTMEGVSSWLVPQMTSIRDVDRGTIFSRSTSDIQGINNVSFGEGLNGGEYIDVSLVDSTFELLTNENFVNYEEYETTQTISMTISLSCTGGSSQNVVFMINVIDTNNNAPVFIPSDVFEFTLIPPLPPGYLLTDCMSDVIVRDIDLTTYRIDFSIEDNPYLEISYDEAASTNPKEFKAILRTTSYIRSIPEPITLTITATDVDLTGDDPHTTEATIRIHASNEFELPDEPIFSQAYYLAQYTDNSELVLEQTITLQQGYDDDVVFSLEGEQSEYFNLTNDGNQILINVVTSLPTEILTQKQIYLVVNAEREFTSGASAAVVVQLPEELTLAFEQTLYEGKIENNTLDLSELVLTQGYENYVVEVTLSEYSQYFTASVTGNIIQITMSTLDASIIEENNFINFEVSASTDRSSATAAVTLHIIKDDNVTPVFEKDIYTGSYDSDTGLSLEPIVLIQGFDETVDIALHGDYVDFFSINQDGPVINLISSTLTPEILSEQHLLFTVTATKFRTVGASTTISISLPTELRLEFEQTLYEGKIENNTLDLSALVLTQGYENNVVDVAISEYSQYFTASVAGNIIQITMSTLDASIIEENNFINFEVSASTDRSSATAAVTLHIIKDDNVTPVFEKDIYTGSYDSDTGLSLEPIVLIQGFDETVDIALHGEYVDFFSINQDGPVINLISSTLTPEVLSEQHLLFTVTATKLRTVGASTAISISLPTARELNFEASSYSGTVNNDLLYIETIVLNVGYAEDVNFTLGGDYASLFTTSNLGNQVTIDLSTELPESVVLSNNFLMLTLTATGINAVTGTTVIFLEIIKDDTTTPIFSQNIYNGQYFGIDNFEIESIELSQGYDNTVLFRLEGTHSAYFNLTNVENEVRLVLQSEIPEEIIFNEKVLLFNIIADKPLTVGANVAIRIDFSQELTNPVVLKFERSTYIGSLDDEQLHIENIVLEDGFANDVLFQLTGDYDENFVINRVDNVMNISLVENAEIEILRSNKFIVLELQAQRANAVSVTTSIIIDVIADEVVAPVFSQVYYSGSYTEDSGLEFPTAITLTQGYDEYVIFSLEGDHAQWFETEQSGNEVSLILVNPIPTTILAANQQLIFVISAHRSENNIATATIVISINDDTTILSFERISYLGSIENDTSTLEPIVLSVGYSSNVTFTLNGDLENFFSLSSEQGTATVSLQTAIPEEALPSNGIILLELQASAPDAISAFATIVFEVVKDDAVLIGDLVFTETYYTGLYTEEDGLVFNDIISLEEGYDDNVEFVLEGGQAQWFGIEQSGNQVSLTLVSPISSAIVAANQQLVFVIAAHKSNSNTARSTIVISLTDEYTDDASILGFERISYLGSIENNTSTLEPIVLSVGYSPSVTFTLHGDLTSFFSLSSEQGTATVSLQTAIPEEALPSNGIILLELQASAPDAISAFATIVFEVVKDDAVLIGDLLFTETYYTGLYTEADGLVFNDIISLEEGYDDNVEFVLEGGQAQWFGIEQSGNQVSLTLVSPISSAIVAANQQLVFVIAAHKSNSNTARATIVISLTDEYTDDASILGFERISYLGSIENNTSTLEPIVLSVGYSPSVTFTLHGDLTSFFSLSSEQGTASVSLQTAIPEEALPSNGIILLELQASAPDAISAFATIVFEVVKDDAVLIGDLLFTETYYTGLYTEADGLVFNDIISLEEGYDDNVEFVLEGGQAQWFGIEQSGNQVSLTLVSPISSAIVAANQQLVFVIAAHKSNSNTARATIVISLTDEYTDDASILGFERISYLGSIENNTSTLEPIVLSVGYSPSVTFTLHGDLTSFFSLSSEQGTATVSLQTAIPEEALPSNGIILLELQASAPDAISAFATIVFEVVKDDAVLIGDMAFTETYYTGLYTEADGLVFNDIISLEEGYDDNVEFVLEGGQAQWFGIEQSGNQVSLTLVSPISSAIVAANQQLVFVIAAHKSNSNTARATIVISLTDEYTDDASILGFERISYLGSIEKNTSTLEPIVLSVGYSPSVTFTLHGDLTSFFSLSSEQGTATVSLQTAIPEEALPSNGIILLELQASAPDAISAFATIVFEVVKDDAVLIGDMAFTETYYTGLYTEADGLVFNDIISLEEGYDDNVEFVLEGGQAQWFGIEQSGNQVSLTLVSPISSAIVAANQQLVFVIAAHKSNSNTARATIVISLTDEYTDDASILGFERISYLGSIENNTSTLEPIVLSVGYSPSVTFTLHGDLTSFFSLSSEQGTATVSLQTAIPEEALPSNGIILLELQASAPDAISAFATIVFEVVKDDAVLIGDMAFTETYYTGLYTEADGLVFNDIISLEEGYDDNVEFVLEGGQAQWFGIEQSGNQVSLTLVSPISSAIVAANQQLVFVIAAHKSNSNTARATIVISLTDEYTDDASILGFERISYLGSIESNTSTLEPIVLSVGYSPSVTFTLHGDLTSFFSLSSEQGTATVSLQTAIPEEALPSNGIILLELQASAPDAISAFATIVFELVKDDAVLIGDLVFTETYYTGLYTEADGLVFNDIISLEEGYDDNVEFVLEGGQAQWFGIEQSGNQVSLTLVSPISSAIVAANQQLVFVIAAHKSNSNTARATIVISLTDEYTDDASILGFERISYLGSIENNTSTLEPIVLSVGYSPSVTFTLHGDLTSFFSLSSEQGTATVSLQTAIPEEALPSNGIILLELQASAPDAISAFATIVFEVVKDDAVLIGDLLFTETYYTGLYTEADGLVFNDIISLEEGYDDNVEFVLEGGQAQWFGIEQSGNQVSLTLVSPISSAIVAANQQLVFVIAAHKSNSNTARATIVISLTDEYTDDASILGFDRISYLGSIENNTSTLEPIVLSVGYSPSVTFTLHGDLTSFFSLSSEQGTATVSLQTAIPEEALPSNGIILLELQASAPDAISAFATIVFEVVKDDAVLIGDMAFTETYYTGLYTEADGLVFNDIISLEEGYDDNVEFVLEGGQAQWFGIEQSGNQVSLTLVSPISSAIVAANQQLVFVIAAHKSNSNTARATIVISLTDEYTDDASILGFERISYLGSIESNTSTLEPIVLSVGYSPSVTFTLHGDLTSFFSLSSEQGTATVSLQTAIPEEALPSNGIILLELQASAPDAISAFATIVFELVKDDAVLIGDLVFTETYYTGLYTEADGLVFNDIISLEEGYDDNVEFVLEGGQAQWFGIEQSGNQVSLTLVSPISSAIVAANQQLVFVIAAHKSNSNTARATIVISLTDEYTDDASILGFERISYLGSIENNTSTLEPIVLSVGYSPSVTFTLHGDLTSFFSLSSEQGTATVSLQTAIPEEALPSNGIILLELQASAPDAISAFATIVFEVVKDDAVLIGDLLFTETYYTGLYTEADGLVFNDIISLEEGYDDNVEFVLEGGQAQWFGIEQSGNQVSLTLVSPISSAIVAANQQLVFVIAAHKSNSNTARATIVISLTDEYTDDASILGFDRISYLGSIENNTSTLEPIVLSVGYSPSVTFTLHGDLTSFFSLSSEQGTATVSLQTAIPEEALPSNGIILLELQASAPDAISAFATIVFELVKDDAVLIGDLVFTETYYTGLYTEADGLVFNDIISLEEGYDDNVEFVLEGGQAQWFGIEQSGNQVSLTLVSPISSAIVAANQQLVFVIAAHKSNSNTARATIVISLTDEYTDDASILGFERISYLGSIENNTSTLEPIVLSVGYSPSVTFTLHGDLTSFFSLSSEQGTATVSLQTAIPEEALPSNGIILLELQASAPDAISAFATIVFELVKDDAVLIGDLVFTETYYTGLYTEADGLVFNDIISLEEGYDDNVEFVLEGGQAQWFGIEQSGNQVSLTLVSPISSAIVAANQQLVFVIAAHKSNSNTARATIVISLTDEYTDDASILGFERISYLGSIENNTSTLEPIVLSVGYSPSVTFTLHGDLTSFFSLSSEQGTATVSLQTAIPEEALPSNGIILLELQASAPDAISAFATIVFELVKDDAVLIGDLVFTETYYTGLYTEADGLVFNDIISLEEGYDDNVEFVLEGGQAQWFGIEQSGNQVSLTLVSPISSAIVAANQQLVFVIAAHKSNSNTARATIVISLTDEYTDDASILGFERISYLGSIENNTSTLEPIVLSVGYSPSVAFTLHGDLTSFFSLSSEQGTATVSLQTAIPEEALPSNGIILLELQASAPDAISAFATIVFELVKDDAVLIGDLVFTETYYTGLYTEADGLVFNDIISLEEGYDDNVEFVLEGGQAQWFGIEQSGNQVSLTLVSPISSAIVAANQQLVFVIAAHKSNSNTARATIVISLTDEYTDDASILGFERISYLGSIENNTSTLEPIVLSVGYSPSVTFTLHGDLTSFFSLSSEQGTATVSLQTAIPEEALPSNGIILLELQASAPDAISAFATIVFEVVKDDAVLIGDMAFTETYYTGLYTEADGLVFDDIISLEEGYDDNVEFVLEGGHAEWFALEQSDNQLSLTLISTIPSTVLATNQNLVFVIAARKPDSNTARAAIIISILDDLQAECDVIFEKILYEGIIQDGVVRHEDIPVSEYTGPVEILGEYGDLFEAEITNGVIIVRALGSVTLPSDVTHVAVQLQAGGAGAVLLLTIDNSATPEPPTVTFDSPSYVLRAEIVQTGVIGQVTATANNGEVVRYSLDLENETLGPLGPSALCFFKDMSKRLVNNTGDPKAGHYLAQRISLTIQRAHLQERLSVNNNGELILSAPANTGVYNFRVIATTVFTQVTDTAVVHLTIDAITTCDDDVIIQPLIVLDRDEEEPHNNLVVINGTQFSGCRFSLTNRWPIDQSWLYVDETGLHTLSIDREHESIAFMALSQVQVELTLHCDEATRTKRSVDVEERLNRLGLYDYGSSNWVLTDSIQYNPRQTLVNLIVNDINDNHPIFIGKENEPIVVGYPVPDLEERVSPRALAELQATDADVGENAALLYWSPENDLAVSSTTGSVHVRDGVTLEHDVSLIVYATDQNGAGLSGSIELVVKLLDVNNIAVVTIRNVFLEDEARILSNLTASVGYEVKSLRAVVISDDVDSEEIDAQSRARRDTTANGASMQLYIYGLIEREPVTVDQLTNDINNIIISAVSIANTISLEDHLEGQQICAVPGRDVGLLAATIVLSVLLFILIVAIVVWFILRWRKNHNYDEFSDDDSLVSRTESINKALKPDSLTRPRMNIEELKRSERRLQEMLEAPVDGVTVDPTSTKKEQKVDIPPINIHSPIVIQSIDKLKDADDTEDEDEFGEVKRRKSIVTFNENVEKIIHVEESPRPSTTNTVTSL